MRQPLYVYCGTGDHLWPWDREPVDSPTTVATMFDWMARTYGVTRMYWRGGQQEIWAEEYQCGPAEPQSHDWTQWCNHLMREEGINRAAVQAARRHRMEIFLHSGLFEHGVQPDVGLVCPYPFGTGCVSSTRSGAPETAGANAAPRVRSPSPCPRCDAGWWNATSSF